MNDEVQIAKPSKLVRVFNIALLISNFLMAFGIIAIQFARETYAEISNQIPPPEGPLMDSVLLDLLLRKSIAILVALFLVVLIIKEKKMKTIRNRIYVNLVAFVALAGYASLLVYLIYSPVLSAN